MENVKIVIGATPNELRNWASMLEGSETVTVHWYHTEIVFKNEKAVEQSVQRTVCTACETELTESNVYCPTCGLWNPNNRR